MSNRQQAYNILSKVCIEKEYANLLLRSQKENVAYTTKIVYGTLQHHMYLKYIVDKYTKKLKEKVLLLLMMATYELKFMSEPQYAVINEWVSVSKKLYNGHYAKLVNAVLHKIANDTIEITETDEDKLLSIQTSHPLWLIKMWNKQYGKEVTKKICFANMEDKIQYIRVDQNKISKQDILENKAFSLHNDFIYYVQGNAAQTLEYEKGFVSIQDISSQMVGIFLDAKATDTILDVCAAPGSKTLQIAELTAGKSKITAIDLYPHRVQLIENAMQRLYYDNIECLTLDATTFQLSKQFDKVLVDAICSGYGVLRGKSDIKYHMNPTDMDSIIPIQQAILVNSSKHVKKDGILVYSTCTLNKKENENQIKQFLNTHPKFEFVEEKTIFPFTYDSDGFYMAKLRRIAE